MKASETPSRKLRIRWPGPMKTARQTVRMDFDQNMGDLYPFSLADKLKVITEACAYCRNGIDNP